MSELVRRFGAFVAAGTAVVALAGCQEGDEGGVDDTSGVFQTPVLLTSGGDLPGTTTQATAVRALAVNDNRVAAIEADLDPSGKAYLLARDAETPVVVIKTGDSLPSGAGIFDSVVPEDPAAYQNENVYVDSSNRMVFLARDSGGEVVGVFRAGLDGEVEKLVATGDGVDGDTIASFKPHLAASRSGLVAFVGALESSGLAGVFFRDGTGRLHNLALEGDPLPGNDSANFNANFSNVFVNDSGCVGFGAASWLSTHAWVWRGSGDPVCLAWPLDMPMPGLPGSTVLLPTVEGVPGDGRVVVTSLSTSPVAICLHRYSGPATAEVIVVPGTAAPSGDTWKGVGPGDVRVTPAAWVSCLAQEDGSGEVVLVRQAGGTATEVARVDANIPGTTGPDRVISAIPRHRLGSSSKIVYVASTSDGSMLCRMNAAGETKIIAHFAMPIPDTTATVADIDRDHFFVNGTGGVVYTVTTDDGGTAGTAVLTGE